MDSYASLMFPDRWIIGGMQMHTFTVGHAILLQELESPFAALDVEAVVNAGLGEVALAMMICRRPWRAAAKLTRSWRGKIVLKWYGSLISKARLEAAISLCRYIDDAWKVPATWRTPSAVVKSSAESMLANVISLLAETRMTRDEIFDMSLRLALYEVCMILHRRGDIELIDEHDEDLITSARQMERELVRGDNGAQT